MKAGAQGPFNDQNFDPVWCMHVAIMCEKVEGCGVVGERQRLKYTVSCDPAHLNNTLLDTEGQLERSACQKAMHPVDAP